MELLLLEDFNSNKLWKRPKHAFHHDVPCSKPRTSVFGSANTEYKAALHVPL